MLRCAEDRWITATSLDCGDQLTDLQKTFQRLTQVAQGDFAPYGTASNACIFSTPQKEGLHEKINLRQTAPGRTNRLRLLRIHSWPNNKQQTTATGNSGLRPYTGPRKRLFGPHSVDLVCRHWQNGATDALPAGFS